MKNQSNILRLVYIAFFFAIFTSIKNSIFLFDNNKTLTSGLAGMIGAACGYLIYKLVENRQNIIKVGIIIIVLVFTLIWIRISKTYSAKTSILKNTSCKTIKQSAELNVDSSMLSTCEICGYIAVNPDSGYCLNCNNSILDSLTKNKFIKNSWLKRDQIYWFSSSVTSNKVDFYNPMNENGFKKDINWKPMVLEREVLDYYYKNK